MSYFRKMTDLFKETDDNWARQSWINTLDQDSSRFFLHRIISELTFAKELSRFNDNVYDALLENVSETLYKKIQNDSFCPQDVLDAEKLLKEIEPVAKKYEICFAAHAHIDVNWLWGFQETLSVAADTFATILELMKENKEFIFSQSQAFLYRIIEENYPEMFDEIKKRVHEGRWEVTASTWVEGDKNMANGESQVRQILYAKKYLSEHLDISIDDIVVDFEPDTFGHVATLPEILQNGKTKYLYHSRGLKNASAYLFRSQSGSEVIAYRDPKSYMMGVSGMFARNIVALCDQTGLDKVLAVYGVCDHGGGPTRKDLFMIDQMKNWPIFPKVSYSTYRRYFEYLEANKEKLPVIDRELNFVFTGCYTSQSRIKMANRYSETSLYDSEALAAIASLNSAYSYRNEIFRKAWINTLTCQFHDILPGSGKQFTREYALGKFQETMAYTLSQKKTAMAALAKNIDTSKFSVDNSGHFDTAFGAGVGFQSEAFKVSKANRSVGETRIYHVFNTLPYKRQEYVEIFVWNYEANINKIMFVDGEDKPLSFLEVKNPTIIFDGNMKNDKQASYWGHWYQTFRVLLTVEGYGYATVILKQDPKKELAYNNYLVEEDNIPRVENEPEYVMENDYVVATFDPKTLRLVSLYDKTKKAELVGVAGAGFVYAIEDTSNGMDAWVVGRDKSSTILPATSDVEFDKNPLSSRITYKTAVNDSVLKVSITLDSNKPRLLYQVEAEWREIGKYDLEVPRLSYVFNTDKKPLNFKYDVAFGVVSRLSNTLDNPGLRFICGNYAGYDIFLTTDSKYGFKGSDNAIEVALIRSSTDPDKYPEVGDHAFRFEVGGVESDKNSYLIKQANLFNNPLDTFMGRIQSGNMPTSSSFMSVSPDNVVISSVKMAEDGNGYLVRCYEADGIAKQLKIDFKKDIKEASVCDFLERPLLPAKIKDSIVTVDIKPYQVISLKVVL